MWWRTNRKSYMVYRTAPFSMTLKDPIPKFQGTLGHIMLSNIMLIRRTVLKIIRIWSFCRIGLKCAFTPENVGFWGIGPLNVIDHRRDPQKSKGTSAPETTCYEHWFNSVDILWPVGEMKEFVCLRVCVCVCLCVCVCVCVCVFVSKKT